MPIYYNPQGKTVSSHEALIDGTRLRPGYSSVLGDGEYARFDVSMLDSRATPGSTFLTDGTSPADRSRMLAAGRYQQAIYDASKTSLNSWRGGAYAAEHEARVRDADVARQTVDALRTARYS